MFNSFCIIFFNIFFRFNYISSHVDLLRIIRKAKYNKSEHTKKYIMTCLKGCVEINKKFLIDFIKTTPGIYEAILDII